MIRPPISFKVPTTTSSTPLTPTPMQTTTVPPVNDGSNPPPYSSSSFGHSRPLRSLSSQSWILGRSTASSSGENALGDSPQIVQQIIEHVPDVATRLTKRIDGKTLQYHAIRDIAAVPRQHKQRILDDYLRIPVAFRSCLIRDILCVPEMLKARLRLSTKAAREKMVKRVAEGDEDFYSLMKKQGARREAFKHGKDWGSKQTEGVPTAKSPKNEDDGSMVDSLISHFVDDYDTWIGKPRRNSIAMSENTSDTLVLTSEVSCPESQISKAATDFARVATQFGITLELSPIATSAQAALSLLSLRARANAPSVRNPFAAFIKQPTAEEASRLPLELRLCYEAHEYVQEQLRHAWRRKPAHDTGTDVARMFWESTTKYSEVSTPVAAMGAPVPMRLLSEDQLRYVWAGRFLERCQREGW